MTESEDPREPDAESPDEHGGARGEDAAQTDNASDASGEPAARSGPGRLVLVTVFALSFAVLAAAAAGFLWWQYRQFYVSLSEADAGTNAALEDVRANLRRLRDRIDDHDGALGSNRAALGDLEGQIDAIPGRFAVLEQRVDALQGGAFDARAEWLRAEAEYYLALANTELSLAGRWDSAIAALELADEKLRELANPRFNPVRSAIADELLALRSVRRPDIDGLVFSLGRLTERVDELPLRSAVPEDFATGTAGLEDAEPGFGRLWRGIKDALGGIIRVERREGSPQRLLGTAEQKLVRRGLELELELARLAALRGEPAGFRASLRSAERMLERDFDTSTAAVAGALALIEEVAEFDIAPAPPDISGSLNALRNELAGSD